MNESPAIRVFDAVRALAFVGDLSMGQPTNHSIRTAWIADQIATAQGYDPAQRATVRQAALLRWSGCTANASGFADVLGDDVAAREAMLAMRPGWAMPLTAIGGIGVAVTPLAQIHCEVSAEVARLLGLDAMTQETLCHIFETYDGNGMPDALQGDRVPASVFVVTLAGDLEIFSRVYGLDQALAMIAQKAGVQYPATLAGSVAAQAQQWLQVLEQECVADQESTLLTEQMRETTSPEVIADVVDLKLPWMTGFSRQVAQAACACSLRLGLNVETQNRIYRAGLLHGIGRASIPNGIWNTPGPLSASAQETIRLSPYWTSRVGRQIAAFEREAEIASFAYERLDGSGYFRGLAGQAIPVEGRVLAAAVAWIALRSERPWRPAMPVAKAAKHLAGEVQSGRFDPEIARLMSESPNASPSMCREKKNNSLLSIRETEVLRRISQGASNKEVARALELSPSTVGTHVESVFRKLGCSTRAAATLKASAVGLL